MRYKIFCRWKKLQEKPHCRQDFVTHTTLSNTLLRPKTSRSLPSNTQQILNFLSNSPADMQIPRILRGSFCLPSRDKCSKKTHPCIFKTARIRLYIYRKRCKGLQQCPRHLLEPAWMSSNLRGSEGKLQNTKTAPCLHLLCTSTSQQQGKREGQPCEPKHISIVRITAMPLKLTA